MNSFLNRPAARATRAATAALICMALNACGTSHELTDPSEGVSQSLTAAGTGGSIHSGPDARRCPPGEVRCCTFEGPPSHPWLCGCFPEGDPTCN